MANCRLHSGPVEPALAEYNCLYGGMHAFDRNAQPGITDEVSRARRPVEGKRDRNVRRHFCNLASNVKLRVALHNGPWASALMSVLHSTRSLNATVATHLCCFGRCERVGRYFK